MVNRPTRARTKETVESDVKTIKGIQIAQLVIVIVLIAAGIIGAIYLGTYISSLLSDFSGSFGNIPFPEFSGFRGSFGNITFPQF